MELEEFVFNTPLYQRIGKDNGYSEIVSKLGKQDASITLDGYNPIKKTDTTFYLEKGIGNLLEYSNSIQIGSGRTLLGSYTYSDQLIYEEGIRSIIFKCKRYGDTLAIVVYHSQINSVIMKVGQYPSVADIHIGKIKQYDKELRKPDLKEFTRAIGLAANGVGIGSFVYLRRIFENLIQEAFDEAKSSIDVVTFDKQRMDEKIYTLKDYLPSFIVENRAVYGILSKGIHELSEDECLAYFDCMRSSIELILDERIEQVKKRKKEELVRKSINDIASKIS